MKTSAMSVVAFVTLILVVLSVMAALDFPFSWVFYLTVFGQLSIVFMVYRVLTDNYKTTKTFEDFYEDYPIGRNNEN